MRPRLWLGFFALCLLWSSAWLVEGAWPSLPPVAARDCLHNLAIAVVLCLFGWKRIPHLRRKPWAKLALAAICLLALPALLIEATRDAVPEAQTAALFALLPVAVVVLAPYIALGAASNSSPTEAWRETSYLLPASLIGLAGILLLLPFTLPNSLRQAALQAIVLLAVVSAAVAGIWMYLLLREFSLLQAAIVYCLANAALFAAALLTSSFTSASAAWSEGWTAKPLAIELAKAVFFELPQVLLLIWLLRAMPPAQFAARYLAVPLLTVVAGYILLRPELTLRAACGVALAAFGIWRLLASNVPKGEPRLMLP